MAPLIQTLDPGLSVEEKFSAPLPLLPFRVLRAFFPFSFPVSEFPHHYHQWTAPNANSSAFVTLRWLKCRIQIEMLVLSCHLGTSSWVWNELFSLLDPDGSDGDVLELSWECCRGTQWGWHRVGGNEDFLPQPTASSVRPNLSPAVPLWESCPKPVQCTQPSGILLSY